MAKNLANNEEKPCSSRLNPILGLILGTYPKIVFHVPVPPLVFFIFKLFSTVHPMEIYQIFVLQMSGLMQKIAFCGM